MESNPGIKRGLLVNFSLYFVAVIFTICVLELSTFYDYKRWALQSLPVYCFAALITGLLFIGCKLFSEKKDDSASILNETAVVRSNIVFSFSAKIWGFIKDCLTKEKNVFFLQAAVAFAVFLGALIVPLSYNIVKLNQHTLPIGQNGKYVQPEVQVIEVAGKKLDHGKGPYVAPPKKSGTSLLATPKPMPVNDYFAYLPGMSFFGVAYNEDVPKLLSDSRWYFSLFGLGGFALAGFLLKKDRNFKLTCFITLSLLPTATLTLATGGDDIPVIAFMVLSAVLLYRDKALLAGLSMGFAMSLKFTAWLMFAVVVYTILRKYSTRNAIKFFAGTFVVLMPILIAGIYDNVYGFVTNAIRFPLGLSGTSSPADSALPGHLITSHFPHYKGVILLFLIALFLIACIAFAAKYPPTDIYSMLFAVSFVMTAAILLAPNTRFGYLNYPVDLAAVAVAILLDSKGTNNVPDSVLPPQVLSSV